MEAPNLYSKYSNVFLVGVEKNLQVSSNLAIRRQITLKEAFAMTVHKVQGMTLDCIAVDCHMINRPGQLGVAIGRATSLTGLQLINTASCSLKQPESLYNSYATDQYRQLQFETAGVAL